MAFAHALQLATTPKNTEPPSHTACQCTKMLIYDLDPDLVPFADASAMHEIETET